MHTWLPTVWTEGMTASRHTLRSMRCPTRCFRGSRPSLYTVSSRGRRLRKEVSVGVTGEDGPMLQSHAALLTQASQRRIPILPLNQRTAVKSLPSG